MQTHKGNNDRQTTLQPSNQNIEGKLIVICRDLLDVLVNIYIYEERQHKCNSTLAFKYYQIQLGKKICYQISNRTLFY
jgi:hypothetical protein